MLVFFFNINPIILVALLKQIEIIKFIITNKGVFAYSKYQFQNEMSDFSLSLSPLNILALYFEKLGRNLQTI